MPSTARVRRDVQKPGVGRNGNPGTKINCLSCGGWTHVGEKCPRCGKDPRLIPVKLTDATKRCTKCGVDQPLSYFRRDDRTADGLHRWCRVCATARMRLYRRHLREQREAEHRGIPETWKSGCRGLTPTVEAQVWRLLKAADRAATAGRWAGHEGLQAYRELRCALDEWRAPEKTIECPIWEEA